jgi:serum/glucocorticoid-regulated kinase 2
MVSKSAATIDEIKVQDYLNL